MQNVLIIGTLSTGSISANLEAVIEQVYESVYSGWHWFNGLNSNQTLALYVVGFIVLSLILKLIWYLILKDAIKQMILARWIAKAQKEYTSKIEAQKAAGVKKPNVKPVILTKKELNELAKVRPLYWPLLHLTTFYIENYMLNEEGRKFVLEWLELKEAELLQETKKGE